MENQNFRKLLKRMHSMYIDSQSSLARAGKLLPVSVEFDWWGTLAIEQLAFVDFAPGDLKNVWMCIDSVRVFSVDQSGEPKFVDLNFFSKGETYLFPGGTVLGRFALPKGEYIGLEIELSPDCAGGSSIRFEIFKEKFTEQEKILLTFDGPFTIDGDQTLILEVQDLLTALRNHYRGGDLKKQIENVRGVIKTKGPL